ncbi:MAG: hypothetical protein IJS28_00370 [Synergistaceae bacterium]|nr:hypothetical protein [Synergistaceae bacterium]
MMRDYLFVSQMPEKARRVFRGSVVQSIRLAAKYSGHAEHLHVKMPYATGDITAPAETSFYGIVRSD